MVVFTRYVRWATTSLGYIVIDFDFKLFLVVQWIDAQVSL